MCRFGPRCGARRKACPCLKSLVLALLRAPASAMASVAAGFLRYPPAAVPRRQSPLPVHPIVASGAIDVAGLRAVRASVPITRRVVRAGTSRCADVGFDGPVGRGVPTVVLCGFWTGLHGMCLRGFHCYTLQVQAHANESGLQASAALPVSKEPAPSDYESPGSAACPDGGRAYPGSASVQ